MLKVKHSNTISGLPSKAEVYEDEYKFWPWGMLINYVSDWIEKNAPANAVVLDYMCGTGYLLNQVAYRRNDLDCFGCSITPEYINYAHQRYKNIKVDLCDARKYKPRKRPDIVSCTAGLHHLPWNSQESFIKKIASEIYKGKYFILGEETIRSFNDEMERRFAVIEMNSAILNFLIKKYASPEIIQTAVDVLKADLSCSEFKIDKNTIKKMIQPYFTIIEEIRFWPENELGYGDYVFICQKN